MQRSWGYGWSAGAFLALVFFGLVAAFPWFSATRNANEVPRMLQARAVVEDGRWDLDAPSVDSWARGPDISQGVDQRVFPNKPPGTTVVLTAAYVAAKGADAVVDRPFTFRDYGWWARLFTGILPTLFICGFALRRYRSDIGAAGTSTGLYFWVFGTPAFAYAHLAYGHQLAAALMFFGVCKLADGHRNENHNETLVGALSAGAAVGVEYGAVFAGLPLAVMLLMGIREGDRGLLRALVGLGGALVPIAGLAIYHRHAFGSYFATGYHKVLNPEFAAKHNQGLLGLGMPSWERFWVDWFALDTGLLCLAPIVAAGVFGLVQLSRSHHERRTEARLFLAVFGLMALVGASLSFEGGWRVGPRYLVYTLPGLILGLAYLFNQLRTEAALCTVFFTLGAYSVIVNVMIGTLWPHIDPTNLNNPVGELLWPLIKRGHHPYAPFDLWGWDHAWVLSFGIPAAGYLLLLIYGTELTVPMAYGAAAAVLVAVVVIASLGKLVPEHPKGVANMEYVSRVYEPRADKARTMPPSRVMRSD